MVTKPLLTVKEYVTLDEPAGVRYELSNGELIVAPSSSHRHNDIRDRLNVCLRNFPGLEALGVISSETDVQLAGDTVRRPDVCFYCAGHLAGVDLDVVPLPIAPDLVIEIVSRNDRADDLLLKVFQYLEAGARAVWLMYPKYPACLPVYSRKTRTGGSRRGLRRQIRGACTHSRSFYSVE